MKPNLRLKSLVLKGFKSFADKTVFDFHEGLTVLVGPNGCGKSNIADAIKWVLGDQSAKSIRGKEMIDVIFNGSDKRPPMGVAEVSLVFDNQGKQLPIDYETVEITRRLYRDGQSEYAINEGSCRLRDIKELFMDTGIGVDAYSIIEQGRVAAFIQSNAKERRQLFEEASGISRLKARKKEAQSKLARSQQNLERLHDIVEEVSRRLQRIRRQAAKAQKFQELTAAFKEKRLTVAVFDHNKFAQEEKKASDDLLEVQNQLAGLQTQQSVQDAKRLEIDEELSVCNQRVQEFATELVRVDSEIQRLTDLIEVHSHQKEMIEKETQRRDEHLVKITSRQDEIQLELEQLIQKAEEIKNALEQAQLEVRQKDQIVEDREEELLEISSHLEELRSQLTACESQQHRLEHMQETTKVHQKRLLREIEEAYSKQKDFNELAAQHKNRFEGLDNKFKTLNRLKEELEDRLRQQERLTQELDDETSQLDEKLTEIRFEKSEKLTEKRVLEDLEKHHAGVNEAVKVLLKEGLNNPDLLTGFIGMVADLVDAPRSVARAIDAALGSQAQVIVVDRVATMRQAEEILEKQSLGQAAFVALDSLPEAASRSENFEGQTRLIDQVNIAPEYKNLFEHLIGDWFLVDDSAKLMQAASSLCVVTPLGQRRDAHGCYVLGSAAETAGLVSRKTSLHELESILEKLDLEEKEYHDKLQEVLARREHHETSRSDMASEKLRLEGQIADCRSDLHVLDQERKLHQDRVSRLSQRLQDLEAQKQKFDEENQESYQKLKDLEAQLPKLKEENERLRDQQKSIQLSQDQAREALVSARLEQSTKASENQNLQATVAHQEEVFRDLEEDLERIHTENSQAATHLEGLKSQDARSHQELEDYFKQKAACEEKLNEARQSRSEVDQSKKDLEAELSGFYPRIHELQESVNRFQLAHNEASLNRSNLIERVREDYDVDIEEFIKTWEGPDLEDFDPDPWRDECDTLKSQIDKLGAVNLEALQEELELDERHAFLAEQEKDLTEASRKLDEVVGRIDEQARTLFTTTFDSVREHFKVTFRQLFGGGRADLKLDSENPDVLEAGIEITACPPGKEPRSITLLSGGEKTMTAVALLFSIFKSRPSPFCVLDEVDAALDESNIDRWLAMLERFKQTSQFLVVTHNKRTMKDASMIYGVTMQEPGVSFKVSLKLEQVGQNGDFTGVPDNKVA